MEKLNGCRQPQDPWGNSAAPSCSSVLFLLLLTAFRVRLSVVLPGGTESWVLLQKPCGSQGELSLGVWS